MNGVVEKKDSKVKEIVTTILRNKRDVRKIDSDMSNSEIEDGYDSDEDIDKNVKFIVAKKTPIKVKINRLSSPRQISKRKSPSVERAKTTDA